MGTYFRRNYSEGERVEIPEKWTDGTYEDWNVWKAHRLIYLDFYNQKNMRIPPYDETVKAPPRIHLRGDGNFGTSSLTSGHMEFKTWLQNKIEEAASGKGSPRFLSEQGRESEREDAMKVWKELTQLLHRKFYDRYFVDEDKILDEKGSANHFRESRHLMLLLKIAAWDSPYMELFYHYPWAHSDSSELPLTEKVLDSLSPVERICWEAVRVLIRKSITSEVESSSFTSVAGMTFIEELQKRIFGILEELRETARGYTPAERCGPKGAEFDEKKARKQLLEEGFGSLDGVPKANRTPERVTAHNSVKLAYDITNMMLEEGLLQRRYMTEKEYSQAFHDGDETKERKLRNHLPNKLVFTEDLWEWIGEQRENHPIFRWLRGEQDRWMYCPPIPHRYGSKSPAGGLLTESNRRIVGGREALFTEFDPPTPRCQPSELLYTALNDLQDTQWEINLDFLSSLFDIELNDEDRTPLPPRGWGDKEHRIQKIRPKPEFETVFTPTDSKSLDERINVLEWAKRIIEHNANVFWHSWTCDFRGRISPRCSKLSPHGNDLDRALIRFKHWKPLGEYGIHWLREHVHNMMEGIESELLDDYVTPDGTKIEAKQRTFEQRSKWIEDNLEGLRKLASDPAEHLSELRLHRYVGRSKALQRIAALIELDRVYSEYDANGLDWSKVKSGQPVYLDASCNGYQHVAALLRDRDLAHNVNLIGDEEESPRDLYGVVAENADREEVSNLIKEILDEADTKDALDRVFSRGVAKCPTMTAIYGSTDTQKCLRGRNTRGKPEYSDPVYELSDKQKLELERIPEEAKQVYLDWSNDQEKEFPHSEFKKHCKDENGKEVSDNKRRMWRRILLNKRSIPLWADGSGLHTALMLPEDDEDKIPEAFRENEDALYVQYLLTSIVAKSFRKSIADSTGSAFVTLEMPLHLICKSSDGLHPGIRWKLGDGFVVNNYYMKAYGRGESSAKMPCALGSAFTPMVPDWYSKKPWNEHNNEKSKARIAVRMHHLYGKDKRVPSELRASLDETVKKILDGKRPNPLRLIEDILSQVDPDRQSEDAEEIRKVLTHGSYSLQRYADEEADRIDRAGLKRGLSPNFVHSLDAYHMRTSIRELSESIDQLSFWPVHDAFGTHACDVPAMMRVVKEEFQNMYGGKDLRYSLDHMVEESPGVEIDFD
ncbi:MAG: hypothetical protein MK237_04800, partial [Gemmatimonadetes bacterium]|nr:hypothetical protein [Gemmatimonadota bacterium]